MTFKTKSEQLFERFCLENYFSLTPIPTQAKEGKRTADYSLVLSDDSTCVVELKELEPCKEYLLSLAAMSRGESYVRKGVPGARVRDCIKRAYVQIKNSSGRKCPGILVIFAPGILACDLDAYQIRVAMFGFDTMLLNPVVSVDGKLEILGYSHGGSRQVTGEQNRSLSAVCTLLSDEDGNLLLDIFHNPYAHVPLRPHVFSARNVVHYMVSDLESPFRSSWEIVQTISTSLNQTTH
jgi:hypothetical protein